MTWGLFGALLTAYLVLMGFVQRGARVIVHQRDQLVTKSVDLEHANRALSTSEERFRSLVLNASDVILVVDADGRISYASESAERAWGHSPKQILGVELGTIIDPPDVTPVADALADLIKAGAGSHAMLEFGVSRGDHRRSDMQATVTNLLGQTSVAGLVLNCRDISERRRYENALTHMAFHDELTGLPNRANFMSQLESTVDSMHVGDCHAVLLIDLDRFKSVNDTLGHAAGDELIREVALRLRRSLPGATVARFGGDEFAVLLYDHDQSAAEAAAEQAVQSFQTAFSYEGQSVPVNLSVGVELLSHGDSPHDAIRDADIAMYHAKSAGGGRSKLANHETHLTWIRQRQLERDLDGIANRDELRLVFQPIFELRTGRLVGAEALVRWEHRQHGRLGPDQFIARAESTGDILEIGHWVRLNTLRQIDEWHSTVPAFPPDFSLHVNLSTVELESAGLVERIADTLAAGPHDPSRIVIEITESSLMRDVELSRTRLGALQKLGLRIAVDDFGTGYSSLAFVRDMPLQTLKIDREFVGSITEDSRSLAVVEAILQLAASLDLEVVAEGIEHEAQRAVLERIGCAFGQGFHLSKPLELNAFSELLRQHYYAPSEAAA